MTRRKDKAAQRAYSLALVVGLLLAGAPAGAEDPLDEYDPTSSWDQVAPPPRPRRPAAKPPAPAEDFRRQIEDWEAVRQAWSDARELYVREKQKHKEELQRWRAGRRPATAGNAGRQDAGQDWGDDTWRQSMVPAPAIDRAIDSELRESGAAPEAGAGVAPAPVTEKPAATAATPAPAEPPTPSPFRQAAPRSASQAPATEAATTETTPPEPVKSMPPAPAPGQNEEAQAGAAAAEAFLRELQEQQKKEQEALRKKARLKVDKEGQVVDPELQQEVEQGPDPEQVPTPED